MTYLSGSNGLSYQGGGAAFQQPFQQPIYSLEAIAVSAVQDYRHTSSPIFQPHMPVRSYGASQEYHAKTYTASYAQLPHIDVFSPEPFLNPVRPAARFVGGTVDIAEYIEEAFEATTGKHLPLNVSIQVMSTEELKAMHEQFGGVWSDGLQGFSINNKGFGQSFVFVRDGPLDSVMITIGHELGHVNSLPLSKKHDEEAKAFAFEMAWIRALHEENIANLRNSVNLNPMMPARNGLHDVAFDFVQKEMKQGKEGLQIFSNLVHGEVAVNDLLWN